MRIGLLNSGGDCPGLNAVIYGVVGAASQLGWSVIGFRDGFEGLLPPGDYTILEAEKITGILKLGGTILGTTNTGNFAARVGVDKVLEVAPEIVEKARKTLNVLQIRALVVVGGDGSLTTGMQLMRAGIPIVGVPKTIDNDLAATHMTFGFDSAVSTVVEGLDRLHTTADSHKRIMVVEVMGRHAGWIALWGGMAGGAHIILMPEIPFDFAHVKRTIGAREAQGLHSTMVVVAEGAKLPDGAFVTREEGRDTEIRLGGIGDRVAEEIARMFPEKQVRSCTLGHLQRGGSPTSLDRLLGTRFGVKAVKLIEEGKFGHMVSYQSDSVGSVPIEEAVEKLRTVDPGSEIVQTARAVGISFGDA